MVSKLKAVLYLIKRDYKKLTRFDKLWIIICIVQLLGIWIFGSSVDNNLIPTIVNGAATTTAILTSFNGILMSVGFALHFDKESIHEEIYNVISANSLVLLFLGLAYLNLTTGQNFGLALKLGLSTLIVAIALSAMFTKRMTNRLLKHIRFV